MAGGLARLFQQQHDDDWIGRAIDGVYAKESQEHWGQPTLEVHPSSAGSICARDIQLGMLGYRGRVEPKSRRRMDNGTWAQRRWEAYLTDAGILSEASVRYLLADEWSGELDVLVQHPRSGKLVILEIKTMNSNRFRGIPPQNPDREAMAVLLERVERAYVYQLTHYYVRFRKHPRLGPQIADECAFLFENTDTQEFHVRYLKPTAEVVARAFAKAYTAREALLEGRLLDPPYKRQSPACRKCYREGVCYKLQDEHPEHTAALRERLSILEKGASARVRGRNSVVNLEFDPAADAVVEAGVADPGIGGAA